MADVAGNVLLVTIECADAHHVSIDVLHWVFRAFGFVHKITTFEKTTGFQALVQFSDTETASSAKNARDGRIIPRYLLPDHVGPCVLRITYSAHTDLSVKFQSDRSRDYTNPHLPAAPSAIDRSGQLSVSPSKMKDSLVQEYLKVLNTANKEDVKKLKGIGKQRATYVMQLRDEKPEPFKSLNDLREIGLSEKQIHGIMKKVAAELFSV